MRLIDSDSQLDAVVAELGESTTFFLDTEFESTRRGTTLSLIQVSTGGGEPFLLDALKLQDLKRLKDVLLADGAQWVLHAGLQDVDLLLEALKGERPPTLFDTQVAWALQSAEANVSLAYLQYHLVGVRSMKSHQTDDWMRRPLPQGQLEYAAKDIEYLPALRTALLQRLSELDRQSVVADVCRELLWPKPELPEPMTLTSFRNAWQLEPRNQAALRFLMEWYNELPEWERLRAPQAKILLALASRLPKTLDDLRRIKGLAPQAVKTYGNRWIAGMNQAASSSKKADFVPIDPPPYATFEEIRLEAWLTYMRAEVSCAVAIAPELTFPARLLKAWKEPLMKDGLSRAPELLEGWRKAVLDQPLRQFCRANLND